jgi:hypothetical protein
VILLPDLQDLSDRGSLYSYLQQTLMSDHLDERLGRYRWEVDMQDRRLSFVSEEHAGRVDTTMSMVASLAPGPRSLLWGWAHPQAFDAYAERLREHGEQHGIAALTASEVPLVTDAWGEELHEQVGTAAHVVGQVAVHVTGDAPYYSVPLGGGSRMVVMLSGHEFPRPRIDEKVPLRVPQAFAGGMLISDHRRAFHGLGALAGWHQAWADDWSTVEMDDPVTGNAITVEFDDVPRFTGLRGRLGPR